MGSRRFSIGRPSSLIRLDGGAIALRLTSANGARMATPLRPMTLRDAHAAATLFRRRT